MFVVVEGIDAAGKATQSRLLADRMGADLYSFPDYGTTTGHLIKGHLTRMWSAQPVGTLEDQSPADVAMINALVFQALQLTNRMEHATAIFDAEEEGKHVVADRYWPSGWVYGQVDGLDPTWLLKIQERLPGADLHLLLDMDPKVSVKRRPLRRDRYEEHMGFMSRAAALYRRLWAEQSEESDHWVVIDGGRTVDEVHSAIVAAVDDHVGRILYPKINPWRA